MQEDFNGYAAQFHLLPIPKLTNSLKAAEIDLQRKIKVGLFHCFITITDS